MPRLAAEREVASCSPAVVPGTPGESSSPRSMPALPGDLRVGANSYYYSRVLAGQARDCFSQPLLETLKDGAAATGRLHAKLHCMWSAAKAEGPPADRPCARAPSTMRKLHAPALRQSCARSCMPVMRGPSAAHSVAIVNTEASVPEFWMLVFVFLVLESCLKLTQYSLCGESPDS